VSAIRLLIVDHDILRYGIRALLRNHGEVEVVGEADCVAQAIAKAAEVRPDVILMDARLPDGSGVDACREILSGNPKVRVLFFSSQADEQTVLMTDARLKADVLALLKAAPENAGDGPERAGALAPQEERVMALVVQGKTNKEIAAALALSEKTVKNYLYNAFQKLGVGRRAQAASTFDMTRLARARRTHLAGLKGEGTKS